MRIIGDLRWDQLTSGEDWIMRFPECLYAYNRTSSNYIDRVDNLLRRKEYLTTNGWQSESNLEFYDYEYTDVRRSTTSSYGAEKIICENFKPASVPMQITDVWFEPNAGTQSGTMATYVEIKFFHPSQSRAIKAALSQKYKLTYDDDFNERYRDMDLIQSALDS